MDIPYRFILNQALYMKKMSKWVEQYLGASSIIFKTKVTCNILDLLFTIKRPARPNLLTRDPKEALSFLTQAKLSKLDEERIGNLTKDHLRFLKNHDDVVETYD
jgi:hypothetical protein